MTYLEDIFLCFLAFSLSIFSFSSSPFTFFFFKSRVWRVKGDLAANRTDPLQASKQASGYITAITAELFFLYSTSGLPWLRDAQRCKCCSRTWRFRKPWYLIDTFNHWQTPFCVFPYSPGIWEEGGVGGIDAARGSGWPGRWRKTRKVAPPITSSGMFSRLLSLRLG